MRAGHGEDVGGLIDQRRGQWLTAQATNVDALRFANLDRVKTWWLASNRMHASRRDLDIFPIADQPPEKPFRDWAATNITCADEKDAFHNARRASVRDGNLRLKPTKSTPPSAKPMILCQIPVC